MLTSFAYRAFRAARIASVLLVAREQLSYVDIAEVDPNRPVNEPIDQGIRLHAAADAAEAAAQAARAARGAE